MKKLVILIALALVATALSLTLGATAANAAGPIPAKCSDCAPPTQCEDGLDNDGNGYVDLADTGCTGPADTTESGGQGGGPPPPPGGGGGGGGGDTGLQCSTQSGAGQFGIPWAFYVGFDFGVFCDRQVSMIQIHVCLYASTGANQPTIEVKCLDAGRRNTSSAYLSSTMFCGYDGVGSNVTWYYAARGTGAVTYQGVTNHQDKMSNVVAAQPNPSGYGCRPTA